VSAEAARDGIRQLIDDSPVMLRVLRKDMVDNGLGQEAPFGPLKEAARYRCRIGRDPGRLQSPKSTHAGMMADSDFYVIAPWFAKIKANDVLEEPSGARWRVGLVSIGKASGRPFAVKAPLTEA